MVKIFLKRYWPRSMSNRTQLHGTFIFSYRLGRFCEVVPSIYRKESNISDHEETMQHMVPIGIEKNHYARTKSTPFLYMVSIE